MWIYHQVKKSQVDEILFASRDGYLIQKMYDAIWERYAECNVPKGIYFYTSRKAAVMTCINDEAYINMIIDISNGMLPEKIMSERFGLEAKDILEYKEEKYGDSVHPYVWEHASAIFRRAERAKRNYFKYMGQTKLEIGKSYAFMDFVSSGTSQKSLKKIAPFELVGIYAGWNSSESKEEVGVHALFSDMNTAFLRRYKIVETFMTSKEPSLSHFDDEGNPVFNVQDRTQQELLYVEEMQKACMTYLKEFLDLIRPLPDSIANDFTDSLFALSKNVIISNNGSILNSLSLTDDWQGKRIDIEEMIC